MVKRTQIVTSVRPKKIVKGFDHTSFMRIIIVDTQERAKVQPHEVRKEMTDKLDCAP